MPHIFNTFTAEFAIPLFEGRTKPPVQALELMPDTDGFFVAYLVLLILFCTTIVWGLIKAREEVYLEHKRDEQLRKLRKSNAQKQTRRREELPVMRRPGSQNRFPDGPSARV